MVHSLLTDSSSSPVMRVPPVHGPSTTDQKVYISKIDKSLKSPHGTNVEVVVPEAVVLIAIIEILVPRAA